MAKTRVLSVAIALSLGAGTFAEAQADDAAATAPTPLPRVTVTAEHESDGYLVDETRTATKTKTPLLDVPQSVSIVSRDLIRDQSMQSLADVARYVPGAGMAQGEGNRDTIILRGNSSTSDFFLDGVRDDVEYFRDLYNLDRVDVLKGPNAMIFGRGGAGGVVNRVTRQANWDEVREVSLQGGSWENKRATFDLGDAVTDNFAARLTGMYEDSESYRDGVELERKGFNPTFAWSVGDATVLRFSYEYFDYDRTADRGIASLEGRPFQTDESTFFGDPAQSPTNATVNQGTFIIDHAFNENVSLRNRTLYADYDKFYQNVFAGGAVDPTSGLVQISAYNNQQLRENFFNQTDVTFSFDTGGIHHGFLAGVELGEQTTDNFRNTGFFNGTTDPLFVPASDPTVSVPVTFSQGPTDADNHGRATIAAVYVQDQIELSPKFEAVLGLRFDQFDMDFTNHRTGDNIETSDDLLSPRAGLIFKPVEAMSLYASYSMTYVPRAGAQLASLNPTNEAFDPEEFENIEVGAKWTSTSFSNDTPPPPPPETRRHLLMLFRIFWKADGQLWDFATLLEWLNPEYVTSTGPDSTRSSTWPWRWRERELREHPYPARGENRRHAVSSAAHQLFRGTFPPKSNFLCTARASITAIFCAFPQYFSMQLLSYLR